MTFDSQDHKDAIIAILNNATFPGNLLELAMELKQAVTAGVVMKVTPPMAANDKTAPAKPKRAR